jgi:hypothetical protein
MLSKALGRFIKNNKVTIARYALALIIPIAAWHHLATAIVDNYVVVRNEKQSGAAPYITSWIPIDASGNKIYFVKESFSYKQAEMLQFMLMDYTLEYIGIDEITFDEDAIYIVNSDILEDSRIQEKCELVKQYGNYCIVLNKDKELINKWKMKWGE